MGLKPAPPPPMPRRAITDYHANLLNVPAEELYKLTSAMRGEKTQLEIEHWRNQVEMLKTQLINAELDAASQRAKLRLVEDKVQNAKNVLISEVCEQPISYFGEHDTMLVTYSRWQSHQALQRQIRMLCNALTFTASVTLVLVLNLIYQVVTGGH